MQRVQRARATASAMGWVVAAALAFALAACDGADPTPTSGEVAPAADDAGDGEPTPDETPSQADETPSPQAVATPTPPVTGSPPGPAGHAGAEDLDDDHAGDDDALRSFTVAATGDVLIHSPVWRSAERFATDPDEPYDFRPMFDDVAGVIDATDLALCHLEVPLSRDNTDLSGFPRFVAPRQLADAIAHAGYDACSTASNHTVDQGADGVASTLDALDEAGAGHAGSARTAEEAQTPRLHDAGGVTVGHVAATYGLNGLPRPHAWMVDLLDVDEIAANADEARDAGAEFVVASLHWGREYQREPTDRQQTLADELLAEGDVDLIVGHHAHVVQPIEHVDGRVVVFGLGNFLSNQSAACCLPETQDGMIGLIDVDEAEPGVFEAQVRAVPTWVDRANGHRIVDVLAELEDEPPGPRRDALEASERRTREALASGTGQDPVAIVSGRDAADQR